MVLDIEKLQDGGAYREEVRHRCITDHFFLAEMMGFFDFNERIHRPAVELYFPKNPKVKIEEQDPIKNRMHLDPRHTFKTTLGRVDSLQWILAFPERITLLNISSTQPLAKAISQGTVSYLHRPKGRASTPLQLAFPELVTDTKPDGTWNTNVKRAEEIDSTIDYTSPKTVQAGWHPWVMNPDDMVENTNSGIDAHPDVRKGVISTYNTNKNALRPGGYINMRGTRYHPFELYGVTLATMDPKRWKVLIRSSVTRHDGERLIPGEFPDEEDCTIHFPEMLNLTYDVLREKFYEDYETFMCQQQNDPQGGHVSDFSAPLFSSIQINPDLIPPMGETMIAWRFPYSGKAFMSKYAEGCAGRFWDGKLYILETWQGIYTPSGLATKTIERCKEFETGIIVAEMVPGIEHLEGAIRNEANKKNVSLKIRWEEFEEDDNRRRERIRQLEPRMKSGHIFISTAIARAKETRSQIINFGLAEFNGIIDTISRLAEWVPYSNLRKEWDDEEMEIHAKHQNDMMHKMVFGHVDAGRLAAEQEMMRRAEYAHALAMESSNTWGLTDILGGLDG